jgi:cytochrome b subunit of formate dehydrogenase
MKRTPILFTIIDRVAAWVLAACFIIYMLSGLDIQLRFLSPQISSLLHLKYIFAVAQTAFMIHTAYAIHLAFKRWRIWNALGKSLLGIWLAGNLYLFYLFSVIHLFR